MSNAEPTCRDGFSNFKIIFLKFKNGKLVTTKMSFF